VARPATAAPNRGQASARSCTASVGGGEHA
jgi:hypothetical protein